MGLARRLIFIGFFVGIGMTSGACTPSIGDSCSTSIDCSVRGDRVCDVSAERGGYCTVQNCDSNTCPDDSLCVEFRPTPIRLASRWCMAPCTNNGDCRTSDGYACVRTSQLAPNLAVVVDVGKADNTFCTIPE